MVQWLHLLYVACCIRHFCFFATHLQNWYGGVQITKRPCTVVPCCRLSIDVFSSSAAAAFIAVLSDFDKCLQDVASDAVSNAAVEYVDVDVRVKVVDCRLNTG